MNPPPATMAPPQLEYGSNKSCTTLMPQLTDQGQGHNKQILALVDLDRRIRLGKVLLVSEAEKELEHVDALSNLGFMIRCALLKKKRKLYLVLGSTSFCPSEKAAAGAKGDSFMGSSRIVIDQAGPFGKGKSDGHINNCEDIESSTCKQCRKRFKNRLGLVIYRGRIHKSNNENAIVDAVRFANKSSPLLATNAMVLVLYEGGQSSGNGANAFIEGRKTMTKNNQVMVIFKETGIHPFNLDLNKLPFESEEGNDEFTTNGNC